MINITTPKNQYTNTINELKKVRDSVAGEVVIKASENQTVYLPNPCPDEKDLNVSQKKYARYLNGAEYDEVPSNTLSSILGAMFNPAVQSELPASLEYLKDDADGSGLTLNEQVKISASECLQMNYIGLLSEFSDLSNLNIDDLTIAEARDQDLKSSIKTYVRESIINWGFENINGRLQLSFVVLREDGTVTDKTNFSQKNITSYLLLSLDNDGNYFQRKYTTVDDKITNTSDDLHPKAKGQRLKFIPFEFCIAEEVPKGEIPVPAGYIAPIANKTLARYRVSADMKESMWYMAAPSSWSKGWTKAGLELFKEMTGRETISVSPAAHNPLPKDAEIGVMEWNADSNAFFKYMERNSAEVRALGGAFDDTDGVDDETATSAVIKAAEKKGVLSTLSDNLEASYSRVIGWCGLFMGVDEDATISINREYIKRTITPQEQKEIRDNYLMQLISRQEALRQLEKGGILTKTADDILSEAILSGEE